jgi:hypothetical protein
VIPSDNNPNPALAIAKTIGGTMILFGLGAAVFVAARVNRHKQKTQPGSLLW